MRVPLINLFAVTAWILCANACNVAISSDRWISEGMDSWLASWNKLHPDCSKNNDENNQWYRCFAKAGKFLEQLSIE